jgi:hypothetical protein
MLEHAQVVEVRTLPAVRLLPAVSMMHSIHQFLPSRGKVRRRQLPC